MDTHKLLLALEEEGVDLDLLAGRDHERAWNAEAGVGVGSEEGPTKYTKDTKVGMERSEAEAKLGQKELPTEDTEVGRGWRRKLTGCTKGPE